VWEVRKCSEAAETWRMAEMHQQRLASSQNIEEAMEGLCINNGKLDKKTSTLVNEDWELSDTPKMYVANGTLFIKTKAV